MHGADPLTTPLAFAAALRDAESRLRACGLIGRDAFTSLCRHLAAQLQLPEAHWPDGPEPPAAARLADIPIPEPGTVDLFGLAYERFFSDLFKSARGQYFTPHPLAALMTDMAAIQPGERVLDPTCGTGGFLIAAHRRGGQVAGIEIDPDLVSLCRLNLVLAGADPGCVTHANIFTLEQQDDVDVILANPPFSVLIEDPQILARYRLSEGRQRISSDALFVEVAWQCLRPGGRLVAVLPRSVLANVRAKPLRAWIAARFVRCGVITLPEGVFRPFGGTAAQAVIVSLKKRPAPAQPWIAAEIRSPGYDPSRKVYVETSPDEISILRAAIAGGQAPCLPASETGWLPEQVAAEDGIADGVPRRPLTAIAPLSTDRVRPADAPDQVFTEIDLADADRSTGEVRDARAQLGSDFKGEKRAFHEGDVLFSRLRPSLNKVIIVTRPDPALPEELCGSAEWIRLTPDAGEAHFALMAARSGFVRAQLRGTSGQTHPRVRVSDLQAVQVPDPGPELRALFSTVIQDAHEQRLAARRRMDEAARLYEAFGRGELDSDALQAALVALSSA